MNDILIFQHAFERLLSEIEGDVDALRRHSHMLIDYAIRGDHQGGKVMADAIPEYCWRWPAYDEQITAPDKRYRDRCAWFLRRLASYGFSSGSKDRMRQSVANGANVKAKLLPGPRERALPECWMMVDKVLPVDAPELDQLGPCWKLDCACVWTPTVPGWKSMVGKPDGTPYTNDELRARAAERHPNGRGL